MIRVIEYTVNNITEQGIVHSIKIETIVVSKFSYNVLASYILENTKNGIMDCVSTSENNYKDINVKYLLPEEYNEHTKKRLEELKEIK